MNSDCTNCGFEHAEHHADTDQCPQDLLADPPTWRAFSFYSPAPATPVALASLALEQQIKETTMTDHVVLPSGRIVDLSKIVHCAPPDNRGYVWTSTGKDSYEFSGADARALYTALTARARKVEAPNE